MKQKTLFSLVFAVVLMGCQQLNSDNWQWENPADWRLPLVSNYPTVILNYLPENQLDIIGDEIKRMDDVKAQSVLSTGLSKLPQGFDTVFTPETQNRIKEFKSNTLTSAEDIGSLVNKMISEVEQQEDRPQVLEDFIDVIDALVDKFEDNSVDSVINSLINAEVEREIADIPVDLGSLLGSETTEGILSGTLFIDVINNTIPFDIEYDVIMKFSDDREPKKIVITSRELKPGLTKNIKLEASEIVKLKSVSGFVKGQITDLNKDNLATLLTGKLVATFRVKVETNKMLISF